LGSISQQSIPKAVAIEVEDDEERVRKIASREEDITIHTEWGSIGKERQQYVPQEEVPSVPIVRK